MVAQVMVQQVQGSSRSWTTRRDEKQRRLDADRGVLTQQMTGSPEIAAHAHSYAYRFSRLRKTPRASAAFGIRPRLVGSAGPANGVAIKSEGATIWSIAAGPFRR